MGTRIRKRSTGDAASNTETQKIIRELNDNDVMLGRGLRPNKYIGNKRLNELVKSRKEEYVSTNSYTDKGVIAREIYEEVTARGGRFLKQSGGKAPRNNEGWGAFTEAHRKVGEERCKQMLREKSSDKQDGSTEGEILSGEATFESDEKVDDNDEAIATQDEKSKAEVLTLAAKVPEKSAPTDLLDLEGIHFPEISPRHEVSPATIEQANVTDQHHSLLPHLSPVLPTSNLETQVPLDTGLGQEARNEGITSRDGIGRLIQTVDLIQAFEARGESAPSEQEPHALDQGVAESFLSALGLGSNEPRFSLQDEIREMAALTEEERTSILADMFGDKCSITKHQSKRQRKDVDEECISFLLNQMRAEIARLPAKEKEALVEAQRKCCPEEFSDARLTKFLRCDGMNAQLAAGRFVRYWKYRREVFGPIKFIQRMTLSEALQDDIVALKAGVFTLLPNRDSSGRHLLLVDPQCHCRESHESASVIRVFWYLVEIMAQKGGSGFVVLVWLKNATVFDVDRSIVLRFIMLSRECCLPAKRFAVHIFYPSTGLIRMLRPIFSAAMNKEDRVRRVIHDVSEAEIEKTLEPYGITSEMLPLHMGGSVQLDRTAWIANRRSIEMEEIE